MSGDFKAVLEKGDLNKPQGASDEPVIPVDFREFKRDVGEVPAEFGSFSLLGTDVDTTRGIAI